MEPFTIMVITSTAMSIYGAVESADAAKEASEAKREDIGLQRTAIELQEKAREIKERVAEAGVRADLRKAQAKMLTKSAISGVDYSSSSEATKISLEAQVESGLATQKELAGIHSDMSGISEQRLDLAESMISEPSDVDTFLNVAAATLEGGMMAYAGMDGDGGAAEKKKNKQYWLNSEKKAAQEYGR